MLKREKSSPPEKSKPRLTSEKLRKNTLRKLSLDPFVMYIHYKLFIFSTFLIIHFLFNFNMEGNKKRKSTHPIMTTNVTEFRHLIKNPHANENDVTSVINLRSYDQNPSKISKNAIAP